MKKKILVTGTNGYVGASLMQKLDPNSYNIIGINRNDVDLLDADALHTTLSEIVNIDGIKIDTIIHCAIRGGRRIHDDSWEVMSDNIRMFSNLLCSSNKSLFDNIINIGSGAEFGMDDSQSGEILPNIANNPYALSKLIISKMIDSDDRARNLRIYGVFDENEDSHRFIKTAIRNYSRREPIQIYSSETQMDFIYMDDFISIVTNVLESKIKRKQFDCVYKNYGNLDSSDKRLESIIRKFIFLLGGHEVPIIYTYKLRSKLQPNQLWSENAKSSYCGKYNDELDIIDFFGIYQGIWEVYMSNTWNQ